MNKNGSIKFIQMSDIHLYAENNRTLLGVDTTESFKAVVNLIESSHETVDFIILSGDLTQDGSELAYKRLAELLKPLHVPIYCLPGNHDNLQIMSRIYPCCDIKSDNHLVFSKWQFILLNSQIPNRAQGYLDQYQLNFMKDCLNANPNLHSVILLHHQPTPVGTKWLDAIGIVNANQFWEIIANYHNINLISFGHVHQEFAKKVNGIQCYATPSTCIQFRPCQDHFRLEKLPPGYRWLHLSRDGHVESGVHRIAEYVGFFDDKATGY